MQRFIVSLLMFLLLTPCALAATFIVKPLQYEGTMPFVESDNTQLAASINEIIYQDMLELSAPKTMREGVAPATTDIRHGQSDISYKVLRNDASILSIAITAERCGAYCMTSTYFYSFDAGDGKKIEIDSIFNKGNFSELDKKLVELRSARIDRELVRLNKLIEKYPDNYEFREDEIDPSISIALYETCLLTIAQEGTETYPRSGSTQMKIAKSGISFLWPRCANHAMEAADPLGKFEDTFSYKKIAPYLNAYGKKLLITPSKK
jgi:hypothetical protein